MNKYDLLWEYLKENNKENYLLTFDNIEKILGFKINHSFLTHKKESIKYGYITEKISLKEKTIKFTKLN